MSIILETLRIAADAGIGTPAWEAIVQQLEDDGAWDFEFWPKPKATTLPLGSLAAIYTKATPTTQYAFNMEWDER